MTSAPAAPEQARHLVERATGLALSDDCLPELARALGKTSRRLGLRSVGALLALLTESPETAPAWRGVISELTVKETCFFRDMACFQALERDVLPGLVAERRRGERKLRLWSAGCATGEEAYTLAILVDRLVPDRASWDVEILATDIDSAAVAAARRGRFRAWSLRATPPAIKERYFVERRSGDFELDPRICGMVSFEVHNLTSGRLMGPSELILCRNTLMYLSRRAARAAIQRLHGSLAPDGWLSLAPAEASSERLRPLVRVTLSGAFFFRHPRSAREPAVPAAADPPALDTERPRRGPEPAALTPSTETGDADAAARNAALVSQARKLADAGRLEEAWALCQRALADDRLLVDGHLLIAEIAQERGEAPAAARALERALFLDPDSIVAHAALGRLLLRQGERRLGRRHVETAARLAGRARAE